MSENMVIAEQAVKLNEIKAQLDIATKALEDIRLLFICIGAPLNDNKLNYTVKQQKIFHETVEIIDAAIGT